MNSCVLWATDFKAKYQHVRRQVLATVPRRIHSRMNVENDVVVTRCTRHVVRHSVVTSRHACSSQCAAAAALPAAVPTLFPRPSVHLYAVE